MERLTLVVPNGDIWLLDDTGTPCTLVMEDDDTYKYVKKLAEYENLEEQRMLLKLPCKVGDRIYRVDTDEKIEDRGIEIHDIDNIVILPDGTILLKEDAYDSVICEVENIVTDKPYLDFYRCFLIEEEAEAALRNIGKDE